MRLVPVDPLELAILEVLEDEPAGAYPTRIVARLRALDRDLPLDGVRPALERMFRRRQVAALWHRYCLPRQVDAIRAEWIAAIDRNADRFDDYPGGQAGRVHCRRLILGWDGWRMGA